jgi:predicted transcriptional regulator
VLASGEACVETEDIKPEDTGQDIGPQTGQEGEERMMPEPGLSRREREVMEIVHRLGRASAQEVQEAMEDPPTNAAVRSTLRILVEKGHLDHEYDGPRYVYRPTVSAAAARRTALERLVTTFFDGSAEGAMTALLESGTPLTPEGKARLKKLIDRAAEEGR